MHLLFFMGSSCFSVDFLHWAYCCPPMPCSHFPDIALWMKLKERPHFFSYLLNTFHLVYYIVSHGNQYSQISVIYFLACFLDSFLWVSSSACQCISFGSLTFLLSSTSSSLLTVSSSITFRSSSG